MSTWVLLRGLTREQAHWGHFPAELAASMAGARIVCVDLPGAGLLHQQSCPWRVEAMVDACQRQLAGQGVASPYRLLGLSLGGVVAAAWSRAWPQAISGLVLVNTSLRPYSPPQRRLRLVHLPLPAAPVAAAGPRRWPGDRARRAAADQPAPRAP